MINFLVPVTVNVLPQISELEGKQGMFVLPDGSININRKNGTWMIINKQSDHAGVLKPNDVPVVLPGDAKWWWAGAGTYPDAGGIIIEKQGIISFNGSEWKELELDIPVKSIENIEKTSTVGLVDTYTISFTNGSSPTNFDVTNGIHDLEGISYTKPLIWNEENFDLEKVRGTKADKGSAIKGYGYVSQLLDEEKFFNLIAFNIWSSVENNTVVAKLYYYNSAGYLQFDPAHPSSVFLAEKTFDKFNTNPKGRFLWEFDDPIKCPKDRSLVVFLESNIIDSLNVNQIVGGKTGILERRVTQTYYFLDINGAAMDEPIIGLFRPQEIASFNNSIYDKIFLPNSFYAVVNRQLNIYGSSLINVPNGIKHSTRFRNVTYDWASTPDNYGFIQNGDVLQYTATEAGKTWYFVFEVLNENYDVIAQKHFKIETYSNNNGSGDKNIVVMGHSLIEYNEGQVVKSFSQFASTGGITAHFIGSKTTSIAGVNHEGYQGQSWGFFTSPSSPFYIAGEINFQAYAASKGISILDYFFIELGINDVFNAIIIEPNYNEIALTAFDFVQKLKSSDKGFPNVKIVISLDPIGQLVEGFPPSRSVDELKRKLFNLFRALKNKFAGVSNVELAYTFAQIDRVNGYQTIEQAPNDYADTGTLIKIFPDPVHPYYSGSKQIAAVFNAFLRKFLS